MAEYYNPVDVHFGLGEIKNLSSVINSMEDKVNSAVLITRGGNFNQSLKYKQIRDELKKFNVIEYEFIKSNPDIEDLFSLLNTIKSDDYDIVIAVGGGSVIDMAKALCMFKNENIQDVDSLRKRIVNQKNTEVKAGCKLIAVPTTSGTGSEVTPWATIWDKTEGKKYSISDKTLFAHTAIVDPEFTIGVPLKITVSTALDALSHATEAYWAKSSNEISRNHSLAAIEYILNSLKKDTQAIDNKNTRYELAMGSLLAGLAFSNTKTTSCHSISYPLTLKYGIGHGIAVAITLSSIMKHNEGALINKEKLFRAFGCKTTKDIEILMLDIFNKNGISPKLRDYGIKKSELKDVVENSYTKGRMDNNPIKIEKEELLEMLYGIY